MDTMNVSLPKPMKNFVDERVSSGSYGSASEYIRELVREDQKRRAREKLETLLLEGLGSGRPETMTREYLENINQEVRSRLKAKR